MDLSIQKVSQIFRTYRTQERIAELNKQANLKTVQTQQDRVSISTKAREQLETAKDPEATRQID